MAWKGSGWLSDPLRSIEHMFETPERPEGEGQEGVECEVRRARAHALLDTVLDADARSAVGSVLGAALEARASLAALVDGAAVAMLPGWEGSCEWAADGTRSPVVALVNRTGAHRSAAGAFRRTGLLAASMPHVSAAARRGELPLSHLALVTRARRDEVAGVFDRDEAVIVDAARGRTADALGVWLRGWYLGALAELGVNEPDTNPGPGSDEDTARIIVGFAGRGLVTLDLTPASLAALTEAVEARIETWRRTGQLGEDTRPWDQLVGAAVMDLIADGSASTRRGVPRPLLIAIARLKDLFDRAGTPEADREPWSARILGGGPIGHAALRELMEQANLQLVVTTDDGEPLQVGRARRLATAAMLAALIARSGGTCEFPGCHATHHRAHAHHITSWEHGGRTDLANLALLCAHHHRLIHKAGYTLTRGPTSLHFRRPDGTPITDPPFRQTA